MEKRNQNDSLPKFWFALSNMIPPIGFFLYFKNRSQFPKKAKKALIAGLTGVPIALVSGYIMNNYLVK